MKPESKSSLFANSTFDDRYDVLNITCSICHEICQSDYSWAFAYTFFKMFWWNDNSFERYDRHNNLKEKSSRKLFCLWEKDQIRCKDQKLWNIIDEYFERQDENMKYKRVTFVINRRAYEKQHKDCSFANKLQITKRVQKKQLRRWTKTKCCPIHRVINKSKKKQWAQALNTFF